MVEPWRIELLTFACEHEWGVSFLLVLGGFSITDTVIDHLEHLWTGTNAGQILR